MSHHHHAPHPPKKWRDDEEDAIVAEIVKDDMERMKRRTEKTSSERDQIREEKRSEIQRSTREKYLYGESAKLEAAMQAKKEEHERETRDRYKTSIQEVHKQGGPIMIPPNDKNAMTHKHGYTIVYKDILKGPYWRLSEGKAKNSDEKIAVTTLYADKMPAKKLENYRRQGFKIVRFLIGNPHPGIIKYLDMFQVGSEIYIFHQIIHLTLQDVLKRGAALGEPRAKTWGHDLISAIAFLHSHGIAHRAIGPNSIWVTNDQQLKIGNFGFACLTYDHKKNVKIMANPVHEPPREWDAPEESSQAPLDAEKEDIYLWAMSIVYMLTKEFIPKTEDGRAKVFDTRLDALSSEGRQLLRDCLSTDPTSRPSASHVLHHLWFKNFAGLALPDPTTDSGPPPPAADMPTVTTDETPPPSNDQTDNSQSQQPTG